MRHHNVACTETSLDHLGSRAFEIQFQGKIVIGFQTNCATITFYVTSTFWLDSWDRQNRGSQEILRGKYM